MPLITSLISLLRKLFASFPHLPKNILSPVVYFTSWYVFLRGLLEVINGFRDISWGIRYQTSQSVFTTLLSVPPVFYIIGGALGAAVGVLYLKAFFSLADEKKKTQGWRHWATAAAALTLVKLYEVIFIERSILWFLMTFLIGWYLIFEFERVMKTSATPQKKSLSSKISRRT